MPVLGVRMRFPSAGFYHALIVPKRTERSVAACYLCLWGLSEAGVRVLAMEWSNVHCSAMQCFCTMVPEKSSVPTEGIVQNRTGDVLFDAGLL